MTKSLDKKVSRLNSLVETNRVKILQLVYQKDTCVCEIVEKLDTKHSLISHHLKVLKELGFILSKRDGVHIIYRLKQSRKKKVAELFDLLNI